MRRLIVNADDFGMSTDVNAGIIEAYRDGLVTSASILANGNSFEEATALAKLHPGLDVGVHLNVAEGAPVCSPDAVRSLLSNGAFLGSSWAFALRLWRGAIREQQIVTEFVAQIERVVDSGLRPSHVDTHLHLHSLTAVLRSLMAAATRFGIVRIRCPHETVLRCQPGPACRLRSRITSSLVRCLSASAPRELERYKMRAPDNFIGTKFMGALNTSALVQILEALPAGVSELMTHPSVAAGANRHIARDEELRALTSRHARDAVRAGSIELIGFGAL